MRAFVVLAVISSAFAAPTNDGLQFLQRTKKSPSPYGGGAYGGGAYGGGAYGGCSGGGHLAAPVELYLSPGSQHYRENEADQHEEMFNDQQHQHHHHHEHAEHARSYYEPAAAASLAGLPAIAAAAGPGPILAPAPSGASAVFPGARVGNCALPMLLSCAPNVISGHLSHSSYGAPAYRSNEHISKKEVMEQAASEQAFHINGKHASWANEERDSLKEEKPLELQAKWSGNQQAKSWESQRAAAPLDLPTSNKQMPAEAPKSVHDVHVEGNLHL